MDRSAASGAASPATLSPPRADDAGDVADVSALLDTLRERFQASDLALIEEAFAFAARKHDGQQRASREPYITHPVAVARILADLGPDPAAIAAALLHDVLEDTNATADELEATFGEEIARLVQGVTKITVIEAREKPASEAESLRRMLLASVDDLRVIMIKLADRLHNMRTLGPLSERRRRAMAQETLEIYAPLANRLGIWQVKSRLEDLALAELEAEAYAEIREVLADRRSEHRTYLANVIRVLDAKLREEGIEAQIKSRAKHYYSIYRKMERKELPAEEIYDVLGVRILVDETAECYLALGIVHGMWPPVQGEFDDYIAKRKTNFYQSLHTTVWGPGNRPLEVQIRTHEMHEVAEFGVAAHWKYKENTSSRREHELEQRIAELRRILTSHHEEASDAQAFVEGLKTDVFRDQVYVFTPKGDVIELPAGSTPIDFAYHIHTEVGHRCRGAHVNGQMVALDTPLETGQTVSISTTRGDAGPSRDWLNPALGFVASNRAKTKIRQWFRKQRLDQAVRDGREVVERQLRKLGLTKMPHDEVARLFEYERAQLREFLAAIGRSEIPAEAIAARLLEREREQDASPPAGRDRRPDKAPRTDVDASGVRMRGADGVFTRVAQCCRPLPGERVLGYVTRGRGVTLHRADCTNIARQRAHDPDRFIRVDWQRNARDAYPVELRISAYDRAGLVRDISDIIAKAGLYMTSVSAVTSPDDGSAVVTASVELPSHQELAGLIDKLASIENVVDVRRAAG